MALTAMAKKNKKFSSIIVVQPKLEKNRNVIILQHSLVLLSIIWWKW